MRRLTTVLLVLTACTTPPPESPAALDAGTLTLQLAQQFQVSAAAWNEGDLDGFMADYAPDSTTTYVGGSGQLIRGVDQIRERYAPAFAPGATRDSLRFEAFLIRPLSSTVILVSARYVLYRRRTTTASGPFTLIMEQRPDGWKIIHDHSSSDQD